MDVVRVRRLCAVSLYRAAPRAFLVTSRPLVAEFAFLSPVIAPETVVNVARDGAGNERGLSDETSMLGYQEPD